VSYKERFYSESETGEVSGNNKLELLQKQLVLTWLDVVYPRWQALVNASYHGEAEPLVAGRQTEDKVQLRTLQQTKPCYV
jgi:hypothetical protein